MLAPNNSSSWSNHTLIYVGDIGATVSQSFACFLDHHLLIGLQIRLGLIASSSAPLLFSFVSALSSLLSLYYLVSSLRTFCLLILLKRFRKICFTCLCESILITWADLNACAWIQVHVCSSTSARPVMKVFTRQRTDAGKTNKQPVCSW